MAQGIKAFLLLENEDATNKWHVLVAATPKITSDSAIQIRPASIIMSSGEGRINVGSPYGSDESRTALVTAETNPRKKRNIIKVKAANAIPARSLFIFSILER